MRFCTYFGVFVLIILVSDVEYICVTILASLILNVDSICKDIDTQSCQMMKAQNSEICFDPAVSTTACPKFCNKCALTCYSCSNDVSNPRECNTTTTCQVGEFCLTQRVNTLDGAEMYTVSCAKPQLCDGLVGKRDLSIQCCSDDLCNGPTSVSTKNINMTGSTVAMATKSEVMISSSSMLPTSSSVATSDAAVTTKPIMTTKQAETTTATLPPVAMTTTAKSCSRDLIFVVDESTSMALVFSNVKQFIADLVAKQTIGFYDTRVSMTTFALMAHNRWDLNSYTNKQQLLNAILTMKPSIAGISDGLSGLNYVINHVVKSRYGDRSDVPDVVVFISDGGWHNNLLSFLTGKNDQLKVTSQLHHDSSDVIAIGIGPANTDMIHSVATDSVHSFMVHRAIDLLNIEDQVLKLICQ